MGKPQETSADLWDFRKCLLTSGKGDIVSLSELFGSGDLDSELLQYNFMVDPLSSANFNLIEDILHADSLPERLEQAPAHRLPSMELATYIKLRQMPEAQEIGKSSKTRDDVCAFLSTLIGGLPLRSAKNLRTASQNEVNPDLTDDELLSYEEFLSWRSSMDELSLSATTDAPKPNWHIASLVECGVSSLMAGGLFRDKLLKSIPHGNELFQKWSRMGRNCFDEVSTDPEAFDMGLSTISNSLGEYYHESLDLLAVFRRAYLRNVDYFEDEFLKVAIDL